METDLIERNITDYFIEVTGETADGQQPIPAIFIDLQRMINSTQRDETYDRFYTLSIDSFHIRHAGDFNEGDRLPVFVRSDQISQFQTSFVLMLSGDSGIGLSGAAPFRLRELPSSLSFALQCQPNVGQWVDPNVIDQRIVFFLIRFKVDVTWYPRKSAANR